MATQMSVPETASRSIKPGARSWGRRHLPKSTDTLLSERDLNRDTPCACKILVRNLKPFADVDSRITTHNGHGTVGKLIMQREHSIIYTGEEAPARLPEEKKLNKDPIQVIPVENAEPLDPLSRINYAKPYPIEHNVKVCEVGMVAPRDVRKINAYYQQESGYETERPQQEPERRRRESSSAVSKEPERRRRESSSSMNKEPERKVRREQRRDSRR